jgi:cytochrome c oxidase subunit 2
MVIALVLVAIVIASVLFHLSSPWWVPPLASNWGRVDTTLAITVVITGVFFVVINLFVAWVVWRYRHRNGRQAAYEPENKKLERWLIGVTTVGIVALLAPGLLVYADYLQPPKDALVLEVVGQQWQWRFRFPGAQGKLGASDARFVTPLNPYGLDPDDPAGQDNILVDGNEVHLPLNRPVKVLLRAHDVLHDFYVPPFRARMNIVPGMVSSFWFTPTQVGRFEAMCAQLCGVGHPNMRGVVVVEDPVAFAQWLARQPTFAQTRARASDVPASPLAARGQQIAQSKGCVACHSIDGSRGAGPTWKGLWGKTESYTDGSTVSVDEAVIEREIREPQARVVQGFAPIMPRVALSDDEVAALTAYIKAQVAAEPAAPPPPGQR